MSPGHLLLTFYRSLMRHRLYAALNVLGLAVGIAVFLVLWLDVRFETGFERWIPHAEQIYNVQTAWLQPALGSNSGTMGGTLDELRADYPELLGTRIENHPATVRQDGQAIRERLDLVDTNFFQVFDLQLLTGDKATLLARPDQMVITQSKARRYFGGGNPIGRRFAIDFAGSTHVYRIAGVLKDPPQNTDLSLDFLVPLTVEMTQHSRWRHWGSEEVMTYLRFADPQAAKALARDLDRFVDRHSGSDIAPPPVAHKQLTLRLQPLPALHLLDPKDAAVVTGLGAVGLLTLLLAAVNYVNLAIARAGLRAREVALRKVMGATQSMLIAQFIIEAVALAFVAALIGLALCELSLALMNAAGGLSIKVDYFGGDSVLLLALTITLVIGLGAGAYPALALSRFRPAAVLASARTPGGGRVGTRVRQALVLLQFSIAIAFIIATGVIVSQTQYLRTADLGFGRHRLVVVNSFDDSGLTAAQRASLLDAWRGLPGVASVTGGDIAPGNEDSTDIQSFKQPGAQGPGLGLNDVVTGPEFFQTYGARLLAGRLLDRAHGADDTRESPALDVTAPSSAAPHNVVLNAHAAHVLGFQSPSDAVGKPIYEARIDNSGFVPLTVVGVVDDIRFRSPHEPIPPTVYFLRLQALPNEVAGVRYAASNPHLLLERMAAQWRRIAPDTPFRAKTVEDNLQIYYRPDEQHGRLFILGAVLAVGIGCVGLYGLASFTTARRVKEIGIRKTLGASTADILRLLVGQFLRPVLLANVIAWPLAWLAMRNWLGGFDQRIGLSPLYFLAATLLTLAIAVATVAGQALAVARAEPAKALRHE